MLPPTVSTSEFLGKEVLDCYFKRLRRINNYKPAWTENLELDLYYPEIKVAVEFQGRGHFRPNEKQSAEGFRQRLADDTRKRLLCEQNGVSLFPLTLYDLDDSRLRFTLQKMIEAGLKTAQTESNPRVVSILRSTRLTDLPPDHLRKRIKGILLGGKRGIEN